MTQASEDDIEVGAPAARPGPRHPGRVLGVLALSQLMIVLDGTVVNIALPSAQSDLGFASDQRQWVITAYALAFGSLLLLGGRLTDVLGRRTVFITGLVGFAISSVVGGAAVNFGMLVAGRGAQGVFGALLAPAALSLLSASFTQPQERAKAFGVFGAVAGGGAAIGLVLGGVLTQYTSWRWCLYINLFFALVALVGALLYVRTEPTSRQRARLDVPGAVLVSLGLMSLVYGLSSAESHGWGDRLTLVCLIGGIVLIALFVGLESRLRNPLLPPRVLRSRDRGGAYLSTGLVSLALFSVFLFLTYYLQGLRGYSPLGTGVAFLPLPFTIAITATVIAPRLLARFGPKTLLVAGPLIAAGSMLLLSTMNESSAYWLSIAPALVLLGLGMAQVFSAAPNLATSSLDPRDLGVGSAMVNTSQQVGGALGTALLSAIAAGAASRYLDDHAPSAADQIQGQIEAQVQAQLASYHAAYLVSAGILVLLAVINSVLLQRRPKASTSS